MARRKNGSGAAPGKAGRQFLAPESGGQRDPPERIDSILRARARALAKAPRERASEVPSVEILLFRLGGSEYGLPTSFVREVVSSPQLVALPRASEFLLGVCAVHGELLPVFDLSRLLDAPPIEPSAGAALIVVGEKGSEFGLVVEEVSPSRPFSIEDILTGAAGSEKQIVRGITPGGTVILDGRALLSDPRLFL